MKQSQRYSILAVALFLVVSCNQRRNLPNPGHENRVLDFNLERFPLSQLTAKAHFKTSRPSKVSICVKGQDGEDLFKAFDQFENSHEIPVLGLYPDYENKVVLRIESIDGADEFDTVRIQTKPLAKRYQALRIVHCEDSRLANGFIFILLNREFAGSGEASMLLALDNYGKIRWTYEGNCEFWGKPLGDGTFIVSKPSKLTVLRRSLHSGVELFLYYIGWNWAIDHLYWTDRSGSSLISPGTPHGIFEELRGWLVELLPESWKSENTLTEIDFFGNEGKIWKAQGFSFHHDIAMRPNGNMLALVSTRESDEDLIIEIDRTSGSIVRKIDFKDILDDKRPPAPRHVIAKDWLHLNALYLDSRDSTIVVSARNQSAIAKLKLESLELKWILCEHEKWSASFQRFLLKPIGKKFQWPWGQHAPMQGLTQPNRILLFDNGNLRGYDSALSPEANFSRAVEFEIDENNNLIKQTWQFGKERGSDLYSPVVGSAVYLKNGNRLICFGAIARDLSGRPVEWVEPNKDSTGFVHRNVKSSVRIIETSGDTPARVFYEISIAESDNSNYLGYLAYRAHKFSMYR